MIASRSIKTGNFVQINTPIFRIVDTSRLEATLNVPERELVTLKAGLPVALVVDALPGKTFQGTVDRVSPVVDSGSGTFRVVCAFKGDGILQRVPFELPALRGQLLEQEEPAESQHEQHAGRPGEQAPGMALPERGAAGQRAAHRRDARPQVCRHVATHRFLRRPSWAGRRK